GYGVELRLLVHRVTGDDDDALARLEEAGGEALEEGDLGAAAAAHADLGQDEELAVLHDERRLARRGRGNDPPLLTDRVLEISGFLRQRCGEQDRIRIRLPRDDDRAVDHCLVACLHRSALPIQRAIPPSSTVASTAARTRNQP